jgi:hypothetical protein
MAIKYRKYKVHYLDQKDKEHVYNSQFSLCIDGAEEAARISLGRRCKEILYCEEYE